MKLTSKNAVLLQVVGIATVIIVTAVTMMYPDVIGLSHSLESVNEKQSEIEALNSTLRAKDAELSEQVRAVRDLQDTVVPLTAETNRIKAKISATNFDLHIPSLLIFIEQSAQDNQLELEVAYDQLELFEGDVDIEQYEELMAMGDEDAEADDDLIDDSDEDSNDDDADEDDEDTEDADDESDAEADDMDETDESSEETPEERLFEMASGQAFDLSNIHHAVPNINEIDVATIPFNVTGSYDNVRSFLIELDAIDFIESNTVDIYSHGESLSANMVMNVFYMTEGGDNTYE